MIRTGAQIFWEMLVHEGVEVVFGFPGGKIIDTYHSLQDYGVRHILVRHEQGAAHMPPMATRAPRASLGVCMATSGPGATNLVTGIANAMMDSVPMVAITGQVPPPSIGTDAFQETDITGITVPITKHNYLVTDVSDLAHDDARGVLHRAHRPARPGAGRPAQERAARQDRLPASRARCACPATIGVPADAARMRAVLPR